MPKPSKKPTLDNVETKADELCNQTSSVFLESTVPDKGLYSKFGNRPDQVSIEDAKLKELDSIKFLLILLAMIHEQLTERYNKSHGNRQTHYQTKITKIKDVFKDIQTQMTESDDINPSFFTCVHQIEEVLALKTSSPGGTMRAGKTKSLRTFRRVVKEYMSDPNCILKIKNSIPQDTQAPNGSRSSKQGGNLTSITSIQTVKSQALNYLKSADHKKQKAGIKATHQLLRKIRKQSIDEKDLVKLIVDWCKHGARSHARAGSRENKTRFHFAVQMIKSLHTSETPGNATYSGIKGRLFKKAFPQSAIKVSKKRESHRKVSNDEDDPDDFFPTNSD